jgi:putative ABC transport system ATP-binding protein
MHAFTVKIKDLWKTYDGQRQILKGVNLTVEPEEMIVIRGRSGSGKTTLLSIIGCIDTPSKGNIFLNGTDATKLSQKELAKSLII